MFSASRELNTNEGDFVGKSWKSTKNAQITMYDGK
jgi:hypothetical protein